MSVPTQTYCATCHELNHIRAKYCGRCEQPLFLCGRYRILHKVGEGGMGAVYQGKDTQLGNALRAIKRLSSAGLSSYELVERKDLFEKEVLILASLKHANLPCIYEYFNEDKDWYLVMDFIEGETLENYLAKAKGRRLPEKETLNIGMQLCEVLDYLHTQRAPIIFRDLKPSNIMRTAEGQIFLIDFGIARYFKAGKLKDTEAFGTRGYAPPEQFNGATSAQSDIYSLGATLHQLITGNNPSNDLFKFDLLPPKSRRLNTLLQSMVEMERGKRPSNIAIVKEELRQIIHRSLPPIGTIVCTYKEHSSTVFAVTWSPDGSSIASAEQNTVHLWDSTTGKTLLRYSHHTGPIFEVVWSPDGTRIASAGADATVQVWDSLSGEHLITYGGHKGNVYTLTWSPDGNAIASAGSDTIVHIWDATTGNKLMNYTGHHYKVQSLAWSPDGNAIASVSDEVRVWNALTGKTEFMQSDGGIDIYTVTWSPDSNCIAWGGNSTIVWVWDIRHKHLIEAYSKHHAEWIQVVKWSPDGAFIASAGTDKTVQIWKATEGERIFSYQCHHMMAQGLAWSPDSTQIISAEAEEACIWYAQ